MSKEQGKEQAKYSDEEIFTSRSKERAGIINILSPSKRSRNGRSGRGGSPSHSISPNKRGIIKMINKDRLLLAASASPAKTPNGRSGIPSPLKRSYTELDQSARKRATRSLFSELMGVSDDNDINGLLTENEKSLADKIIEASKKDGLTPILRESDSDENSEVDEMPTVRDKLLEIEVELSPSKRKKFIPTPIPKKNDFDSLLLEKDDGKSLFTDGFEGFFEQHNNANRKRKSNISGNTMVKAPKLEYHDFLMLSKLNKLFFHNERENLINLHRSMFTQWYFELMQGFSLGFYGVGSKREIILEFVKEFLISNKFEFIKIKPKAVVVNGYNPDTSLKEILDIIIPILIPNYKKLKLPRQPQELISAILKYFHTKKKLDKNKKQQQHNFLNFKKLPKLILLIHNIDGESLRDDRTQYILSKLSTINELWFISTLDHINTPIMWDSSKMSEFNFVWHDLTTFENYNVELSFKDILSLGQSNDFVGSKGAKYVLTSLTSNARSLYRVLISNQLQNMEDDSEIISNPQLRQSLVGNIKHGLEFKHLFNLCLEEFIASNEISFRTVLGEFVEHKMCNLVKDGSGTEIVYVPFGLEEMAKLLEEELDD
ncbi:hypothetical protein PACTADRAFT_57054 [Pachysolen tannophilus NRRL Y-2460]|uniref:Origin recognition complex subunit 2 n=1 Tax=Pachysolen tannophilus NRRL Y-2460 TaxID=669874 RepID=A0A1E4TWY2_PACTA|nr:hypothetical protein PACTADRAFT_57054 [Pachysolen tannophilus NRRL Y-2460]